MQETRSRRRRRPACPRGAEAYRQKWWLPREERGNRSGLDICADVDDTTRARLAFEISLKILGHHQRNGPAIDSEVCVNTIGCRQVYLESLLTDQLRIERFENAAGVVVNKHLHGPQLSLTSIK